MFKKFVFLFVLGNLSPSSFADTTAPVSGFARSFILDKPIANASITVLETGLTLKTNDQGQFGPFQYRVGQPLTLTFKKFGYKTTQTGTVIVPKSGLTNRYNNPTFQVPSFFTFLSLSYVTGARLDPNMCHVATTITEYHKTLDDIPQGEAGVTVTLLPAIPPQPFYFGIFKSGWLKDKTDPFTRGLTTTSKDGGMAFFNVPPRNEPYEIIAYKKGKRFTSAHFICQKGVFINISPPNGPMVMP